MDILVSLLCVLAAVLMALVLLLLWRMQCGWPKSHDDVFRQGFRCPPQSRRRWVWPQLRLRR
jgi:hypothetical protein